MRFPLAALFFIIGSFIFFVLWAVSSLLITKVNNALDPHITDLGWCGSSMADMVVLLPYAFGIICALFFIMGLLVLFIFDSLADEPEYYPRGRRY